MPFEPYGPIMLVVVVLGMSIMLLLWLRATRRQKEHTRWEATEQEKQARHARAALTAQATPKERQAQAAQNAQMTRAHMEQNLDDERTRRAQLRLDQAGVPPSDQRHTEAPIARGDDGGAER